MSNYNVWTFTEGDMTLLANEVKEHLLFALASDGFVNDPKELAQSYVIVIHQRGWLGRIYDACRGVKKDGAHFAVLKVVNYSMPDRDGKKKDSHLSVVPTTNIEE